MVLSDTDGTLTSDLHRSCPGLIGVHLYDSSLHSATDFPLMKMSEFRQLFLVSDITAMGAVIFVFNRNYY